jgi:hypothetical protein
MSLTRHRLPEAEAVMDELLLRRKNAASRSYWLPSAVIIIMGQALTWLVSSVWPACSCTRLK